MKLLHIDSSITGDNSVSHQLSAAITEQLQHQYPDLETIYYNLDTQPFSHLSSGVFSAQGKITQERNDHEQREVEMGARALQDFQEADILVIGAPMYNFSVPSQLKAWIDRIAVAGKTFRYTENGPVGLAGGKRVIVASVRGGFYGKDSGLADLDHQESYLSTVFGFLGITNIEFIRAEGVSIGPHVAGPAIEKAKQDIIRLAA